MAVAGTFIPAAFAKTDDYIDSFLKDTAELVAIDSKTGEADGVRKVADVYAKRFKSIGWIVTYHEIGKWGPGLVITNSPDQSSYDVILCGHLDTVQPVGNAAKYPLKVVGGRAHGAGVADDKASINAIWWICRDLPKSITDKLKICVLLSPAEEIGPEEVNAFLLDEAKKGSLAMVYEPGRPDGSFVKVRKSCNWFRLDFKGVAAHAGNNPEDGRNAIDAMARAIPEITKLAKDYEGVTINTGVVAGGTVPNTVAEEAHVTFDMRTLKNEHITQVLQRVQEMADKGFADGVKTTMSLTSKGYCMELTPASEKFIKLIDESALALGQKQPNWLVVGGASDGNALSAAGIAVVDAMGVCGGNLHNAEKEYIELSSIKPRIALGKEVLRRLAEQK